MNQGLDLTLPPDPLAAKQARDAVSELNGLPADVMDDVRLLVSELVTNAVRHASLGAFGRITVRTCTRPDRIRVEVADTGPGFRPRPRVLSADQTSGWGLYLVAELADRWGVDSDERTLVWFELDRPATAA